MALVIFLLRPPGLVLSRSSAASNGLRLRREPLRSIPKLFFHDQFFDFRAEQLSALRGPGFGYGGHDRANAQRRPRANAQSANGHRFVSDAGLTFSSLLSARTDGTGRKPGSPEMMQHYGKRKQPVDQMPGRKSTRNGIIWPYYYVVRPAIKVSGVALWVAGRRLCNVQKRGCIRRSALHSDWDNSRTWIWLESMTGSGELTDKNFFCRTYAFWV